jgi:hypothetical protein
MGGKAAEIYLMEAPVFLLFCLAVGYLMFWTVKNEKVDPDGGHDGWFAIKGSDPQKTDDKRRYR